MERICEQFPIRLPLLPLFIPFPELANLIAHKIQLLSGMRIHIGKHSTALGELTQIIAPHFLDDCRLSMYNLIIGKWQQVQFIVKIIHGEPKVSVMGRPLKRERPEIIQRIVHPAHIPFIIKPQSSVFNRVSPPHFSNASVTAAESAATPLYIAGSLAPLIAECHVDKRTDIHRNARITITGSVNANQQGMFEKFPQQITGNLKAVLK